MICGDLNGDMGSSGGSRSAKKCTKEGRLIVNFMAKHNLFAANLRDDAKGPINTFFGPNGESCIDYVMITKDIANTLTECVTSDNETSNVSDHNPVHIKINIGEIERNTIFFNRKGCLKWSKISDEKLLNDFAKPIGAGISDIIAQLNSEPISPVSIDSAFDRVIDLIKSAEHVIPRSKHSKHIKAFSCPELTILKLDKVKKYKAWCAAGRPRDSENPLRIANCNAKKLFRKRIRAIAKSYEDKKICEATKNAETDRNSFWHMLKKSWSIS